MATATSLTAETIEEMMGGWVQVSVAQETQAALLSTFQAILAGQQASQEEWENETLPALYAETEAASIALSNLSGTVIPDLQVQIDGNDEELQQLNDVIIPDLQAGLNSNYEWIANLNDVVLPQLYSDLDANNAAVNELTTVTMPALQTQVDANTAAVAAIDISGLQTDLDAAEAAINTLNTVTLPALQTQVDETAAAVAGIDLTALQSDLDAAEASINTLNTVTIPGLESDISANAGAINNLNTVTLPGLNTRLTTAEGDVNALEGKFPITGPDIAANAITANKIAVDQITAREIAANAITAAEIAADTITANEIAANAVTVNELAANAVTATKIAADAVVAGKIAADAITAREIQADAITASEIAADAVTATEIAAGSVIAGKIGANAVTATTIAADAVTAGKIAADAITAREIQADAITASEIAADAVTATEIAAGSVIAGKIGANAVTATTIAADAVTAGKIAADAITAREIAADAVTATEIKALSITAAHIATDTITANQIAADAITATELKAGAVVAGKIAADAVTANEIAANAVTASEIASNAVTAIKIQALTITGDKVAANTIAATKLTLSDLTNYAPDGDFSDPLFQQWDPGTPAHFVRVAPAGELPYGEITTATNRASFMHNYHDFECAPGDQFYVKAEVYTPAQTDTLQLNFAVEMFDKAGTSLLWNGLDEAIPVAPNTPWTKLEGTIKVANANCVRAIFNAYVTQTTTNGQKMRIRQIQVRKKNAAKLIVDGTIKGQFLEANTITADQIDVGALTGDLLAAEVVMGGVVRAGDLDDDGLIISGYSEMGSRGIYTVDDKGETIFYAPTASTDGAFLKAHVDLLSADVRDNFTMHGTNNSIATEAELTLSAGVEAPSVPPVLQQVWDQIQFNKTTAVPPHTPNPGYNLGTFAFNPAQVVSMTYDTTWSNYTVIQQKSNGFRVWRFNGDGTIQNNLATGRPWVDDWNDRTHASICWNDDKNGTAALFLQGDQWYIWDPQYINKIPNSWIRNEGQGAVLAYDTVANQYALVQNNGGGNGTIEVRRFTVSSAANFPNAASQSTTNFEAASGLSVRLNAALYGSQSGLANSWVVNSDDYQTVYVFSSTGVLQNDEGSYRCWAKPGAALGMAHNGTSFCSVDSAGLLTFYTNWTWTSVDAAVWIGASAADTDAGGTGIHETPVGTMKNITLYRRSKLKITMPETNDSGNADDPDTWRLYFKRGSNVAPTDKTLLKQIGDIGSPIVSTSIIISADATGGNPPGGIKGQPTALNNFPGADPGRIESAGLLAADSLPILQMLGSGAGRWGTLTVDTNGKAVIGGDTGWITMALTSPWVNYGAPYASAAYRKIGSQVFLRGLVKGATGTTGTIFTLPVGFRPTYANLIFSAIVSERERSFAATGDNPAAFTTGTANSHTHSANPPAMDVNTLVTFANAGGRLDVQTGGAILHAGGADAATGTNWISLEGITFLVD